MQYKGDFAKSPNVNTLCHYIKPLLQKTTLERKIDQAYGLMAVDAGFELDSDSAGRGCRKA